MADLKVGSLPICDGRRLVSMLTDRNIPIRTWPARPAPSLPLFDA